MIFVDQTDEASLGMSNWVLAEFIENIKDVLSSPLRAAHCWVADAFEVFIRRCDTSIPKPDGLRRVCFGEGW
jgi:hypothetical protein